MKRIIPCLDVHEGRVVNGVNFVNLRDAGDPVELARFYDAEGADELVFLDITATHEERPVMLEVAARTAEEVFIPYTVGGGMRSADDIRAMTLFLAGTAGLSVVAGYGAYSLGWVRRAPRIIWILVGGYVLASLLTFLNVWVTARLMFTSHHDFMLATVLLLFAGGIATSLGYFLSAGLRDSLTTLNRAAQEVAANGSTRVCRWSATTR